MDIEKVRELVNIIENSSINVFEISDGDVKIKLEKNNIENIVKNELPSIQIKNPEVKTITETINNSAKIEIKSPMVGVFYKASAPDAEPFVRVGSKVKKGDVLCIIEAMKLMNEIHAEQDGVISEVCINDGEIAEFSQVLFRCKSAELFLLRC